MASKSPLKEPILFQTFKDLRSKIKNIKRPSLSKLHFSVKAIFFITIGSFLITLAAIIYLFKDIPNPTKLTKTPAPVSTQILDRSGQLLYEVFAEQNRIPISLKDLPPHVYQ